ncbi:hypothetical protein I3843_12G116700 [Carya illinoinensis]|nr:hypothetical protein I3843_12G116700 [Carya illinoinensis]
MKPTDSAAAAAMKRVFSENGSLFMDPEVVEIPPTIFRPYKLFREKEVILHDVIDIDKDLDSSDVMFGNEKFDASNKGKAIEDVSHGSDDHQAKEALVNYLLGASGVETLDPVNGAESPESFSPVLHNIINLDSHGSDLSYDENNDVYVDDFMDVDEYAIVQAHFDSMNIPPGIEAPIPWLPYFAQHKKKPITGGTSHSTGAQIHLDSAGTTEIASRSSLPAKPVHINRKPISVHSSGVQTKMDSMVHPPEMDLSSPRNQPLVSSDKKKSSTLTHRGSALNLPSGKESKPRWFLEAFKGKKKPLASSNSSNYSYVNQFNQLLPPGVDSSIWGHYTPEMVKTQVGTSTSHYPMFTVHGDASNQPPGVEPSTPWWQDALKTKIMKPSFTNHAAYSGFYVPFHGLNSPEEVADNPWVPNFIQNQSNIADGNSAFTVEAISVGDKDENFRKFQLFKQFDTVEDHSDHHYSGHGSSMKQVTRLRFKRCIVYFFFQYLVFFFFFNFYI